MGIQTSLHASSLLKFLILVKNDKNKRICDSDLDSRILSQVNLTGKESRQFSEEEIKIILKHYTYFKEHFLNKDLWPIGYDD